MIVDAGTATPNSAHQLNAAEVLSDVVTLTRRNFLRLIRTPKLIFALLVQPAVFVVLFRYVFGASLDILFASKFGGLLPNLDIRYVDYLIPGVIVQVIIFTGGITGVSLAEDLQYGAIDRFRSLPISRFAVLAARTAVDGTRGLATAVVVLVTGFLVGFQVNASVLSVLGALALATFFGYAVNWIYAWLGLVMGSPEAAQSALFLPAFPLTFAASTFAPIEVLPGWLQPFARHQPVSVTADAVRALLQNGDALTPVVKSLLWSVGLLAVFIPIATRRFARV